MEGGGPDPSGNRAKAGLVGSVVVMEGGGPDPSGNRAMANFVGAVVVTEGGGPDPSANAAAVSDISNNVTARIRFMVFSFWWGNPRR
jgi:hypothetical protein